MGEKDTATKKYMSEPTRFADAFNGFLFQGEQVIKASELQERDATELSVIMENESMQEVQKIRDLLKEAVLYEDGEARYLLLGIENQTDVHYAMPVKCMMYDALNYDKQVRQIASQNRASKKVSSAEYLSGFAKNDTLKPIITLTIYFGSKQWDAARSLHEMLGIQNKRILKYVNNYDTHLLIPKEIADFSKFHTDLQCVVKFLANADSREKLEEDVASDKAFEAVAQETVELINLLTDAGIPFDAGEKEVNVCKGMKQWAAEERAEGRAEGREEGRAEGRADGLKAIIETMKLFGLDEKELCDTVKKNKVYKDVPDEEILKYL